MSNIEQRYLRAIQSRVCAHCIHLLPGRMCGLPDRICPVERNLREIVQIVHYVHDESLQPYLDELRRIVCCRCEHQGADGRCPIRERMDCPLDRYFVLVVEAIDDVHEELRAEAHATIYG